jgi:hypothetical protein
LDEAALRRWISETEKLLSHEAMAELDIYVPLVPGADDSRDPIR